MKTGFKKITLAAACVAALGGVSLPVYAVNWLGLQGTEPADSSGRAKVWGFIQAQYQKDKSDAYKGAYIPPELVGPNLTSQSTFNVNRARIGVRGTGFPLDSSVNYFLLVEYGNNALTSPAGGSTLVSDASITVSRIPDAHVRVGLFKYPGADEGFQGIATFAYINFTEVTNQLLLERFPNQHYTANLSDAGPKPNGQTQFNRFNRPVGAFRDTGIEVFNTFKYHGWQNNYAVMIGNGNGMNFTDNNTNKDTYLYWSSEKVYGGKGPFQQGLKFFLWHQQGKRVLYNPTTTELGTANFANTTTTVAGRTEYDRMREGLGMTYRRGQFRATAEYMKGKGMIFLGPDNPTFTITAKYPSGPNAGKFHMVADGRNGKANGWYVEGGWFIPRSNWELDARYDVYKRLTGQKFETHFKTTTLGVQYRFNKLTRLTIDAASRNFDAVNFPAGAGPNAKLSGVGERYSIQLTHIF